MSIKEINLDKKPTSLKMFLCMPNTSRISTLKDVSNVSISTRMGEINELSFTIPVKIERRKKTIDNPLIEKMRHRYLIEVLFNNQLEYFVILEDSKSYSDNGEEINFKMKSRAFLLADKTVKNYLEETKTLTEHISELISQTRWKIGYVDADFDLMYRSYEAPSQTVLEAVFGVVEKFKAILFFDTVKLELNFYSPAKIGRNRGLKFKKGKYLESFNVDTNSLNTVTRLRVYGAEGLTFRNLSPTGSNYLEDFGLYMYPFKRDENKNIIQSSYYMSDSLCSALADYTQTLTDAQGVFDDILSDLSDAQDRLQKREQELSVLRTELVQIMESIDTLNSAGESGSAEHQQKVLEKTAKEDEIVVKESEITLIKEELEDIEGRRYDLQLLVRIEAHLTSENLLELNEFVIEKEYTNDSIVDEEDLLEDGLKEFNRLREPIVDISLNIENFLEIVEFQNDWDKLRLGDVVKIESKVLKVGIEARILEINYNKEDDSITVRIANENELKNDYDKMVDEIYSASSTSTVVNMDRYKWNLAEDANDGVSKILNSTWDATKQGIQAGYKQMLDITERGIFVRSPEDPNNLLVLQNGVMGLSNNGGDDWNLAITPAGIFAERLVGRILLGNKLVIEDEDGIIQMTGSKQEVFDKDGNVKVTLGEYEPNKYGLKIDSGALEIIGGINSSQLNPSLYEELQYDDAELRNDLRLTAPLPNSITLDSSGISAYTSNSNNYARMDYRGLYIQGGAVDIRTSTTNNRGVRFDTNGISGYNSGGTRTFYLDTNGNLTANTGTFGGSLSGVSGTFTSLSSGTISGSSITGGTITGTSISGGSISSNTTININTDVTVGNNIYMTGYSQSGLRKIVFDSRPNYGASIESDGGEISLLALDIGLSAFGYVDIFSGLGTRFLGGGVSFSGVSVTGLNTTAVLA